MATRIDPDVLIGFANDPIDVIHSALDDYGSELIAQGFEITKYDVGGAPTSHYQSDVHPSTFSFEPMTPEDFKRLRPEWAEALENATDPGGPPGFMAWVMRDHFDLDDGVGNYENPWYDYYNAKELDGEQTYYSRPGDAPWTEGLSTEWNTCVANRMIEVDTLKQELQDLMQMLVSAAEDYADTDMANYVDLSDYSIDGS